MIGSGICFLVNSFFSFCLKSGVFTWCDCDSVLFGDGQCSWHFMPLLGSPFPFVWNWI